eukprot:gene47271-64609_t
MENRDQQLQSAKKKLNDKDAKIDEQQQQLQQQDG